MKSDQLWINGTERISLGWTMASWALRPENTGKDAMYRLQKVSQVMSVVLHLKIIKP